MKGVMKGIYFMIAILLIALALPFGTSFVSAQEESDGIIFEFCGGGITREPATETMVQIAVAHTCEVNDELVLKKVEIYGENKITVKTFDINETLESVADSYHQLKLLSEKLESAPDQEIGPQAATIAQGIRSKSFSTKYFTLDLNELKQPLTLGDRVPIIARATFVHHGEALVIERSLWVEYQPSLIGAPSELYTTNSLPNPQDWKPGVQHVHTGHSDWDATYLLHPWLTRPTVLNQSQAAKDAGLSRIIITDHHTMMDAEEWNAEKNECEQAENSTGIKVMLGLEVGSCAIFGLSEGHYLAYDIDSYVNPPNNCQDMIDEVNEHGGFGFIAHPYGGTHPWGDWNVTGYTGPEIMNGPTASNDTINKWTEILTNSSARIFGIGNSDAHWQEEVANAYTWCDIGGAVTHSSVYSALENGHSVVTNGPLIAFTIGDKKIGDTVYMTADEALLDIVWVSQQAIQKIEVYTNEGNVKNITNVSGPTGSTSVTVDVTPQTAYIRLRGVFENGEAYTNPIWVFRTLEGFEWGDPGDSLVPAGGDINWMVSKAGSSVAQIDTVQHSGAQSARIYRDGSNSVSAYYLKWRPDRVGFYLLKDGNAFAETSVGDGTRSIRVRINSAEKLQYSSGSGYQYTWQDTGYTISSNTWYLIEFRNISWWAGTYDIYVNGNFKYRLAMHTFWCTPYIVFGSSAGSGSFWIDDILDY
jgi:hypothetical protein